MKAQRVTLTPLAMALAICWLAAPSAAWSSFMGPALTRPTRKLSQATPRQQLPLFSGFGPDDNDVKDREGDEEESSSGFSLANLFSSKGGSTATATSPSLRGRNKALEPHPSVRPHISPLNRLGPDFDFSKVSSDSDPLPMHPDVKSGNLPNGFSYVILPNKSPPGRFEAHLQVFSGSCTFIEFAVGALGLADRTNGWRSDGCVFLVVFSYHKLLSVFVL